ncbi:rhodanese-like domain-containing protein [Bacillus taeanensis]|uniref:Rhodanese-like domain-containing protein n=1 Tax=Bacillus taeanensis TaxID=273032 RepID=A0A366Y0N0_9BACI|nr:rhodanese-like domain-containing protein [Bacillus taeanensis]RBW71406.1 rhodanese-like domain-containing protein [Bacillus taeanensis]
MAEHIDTITTEEVEALLRENKTISLIDVREDEEVAEGKIPQAHHIRLSEIPERLNEIEKNEEHILICRSGKRSEHACEYLQQLGYQVKNMVGGMLKWEGDIK